MTSLKRILSMSIVGLLAAVAAVFVTAPAQGSTSGATATVSAAASGDVTTMGAAECISYLREEGYDTNVARSAACVAGTYSKPICVGGLLATRVNPVVAGMACFV